jgi:hypothetical protein
MNPTVVRCRSDHVGEHDQYRVIATSVQAHARLIILHAIAQRIGRFTSNCRIRWCTTSRMQADQRMRAPSSRNAVGPGRPSFQQASTISTPPMCS